MQTYRYDDFVVSFERGPDGDFVATARPESAEQVSAPFRLPFTSAELAASMATLGVSRSTSREVGAADLGGTRATAEEIGGKLATALFGAQLGQAFDAALQRAAGHGNGVRLTLSLGNTPELLSVPWEFLYRRPTFLASQRRTPVVRYLEFGELPAPQRIDGAVRVLGVVASPSDLAALDVAEERARVETALAAMSTAGLVELEWCDPATPRALRQRLRDGSFHVLHFIGHSAFSDAGDGLLFLEDDDGTKLPVSESVLTNLLGDQTSLRLAVLNSCEGAKTTTTDPFAGIATSLVALGVPAVVAMQFTVSDRAAIAFAEELFTSLIGRQYPIDAAVSEARKAVFTEVNEIEWATPVLFLRAVDGQLFDFAAAPALESKQPGPLEPGPAPPADPGGWWRRWPVLVGAVATLLVSIVAWVLWPDGQRTASASCGGVAVPAAAWSSAAPADGAPIVELLQRYFLAEASAKPGQDNTAALDEMKRWYPTLARTEATLTNGYSNKESNLTQWIGRQPGGAAVVGQLVYDNAGRKPCRTGFLCFAVQTDGQHITGLAGLNHPDPQFHRYPFFDDRWYGPAEVIPNGQTAERFLTDSCRQAGGVAPAA